MNRFLLYTVFPLKLFGKWQANNKKQVIEWQISKEILIMTISTLTSANARKNSQI